MRESVRDVRNAMTSGGGGGEEWLAGAEREERGVHSQHATSDGLSVMAGSALVSCYRKSHHISKIVQQCNCDRLLQVWSAQCLVAVPACRHWTMEISSSNQPASNVASSHVGGLHSIWGKMC